MLSFAGRLPISALLSASLAVALTASAATVTVPGDFATLQAAVDAVQDDADPGEVIITSSAWFDEAVTIRESVTIRTGPGASAVIERLTGYDPPIQITGSGEAATTVVLRDITVRANNASGGSGIGILIRNDSASALLTVQVVESRVEIAVGDQGIHAGSGTGEILLEVTGSACEAIGGGSGAPACIRAAPAAAPLTLVVTENYLRSSRAAGVTLAPSVDAPVFATIERNVFEGFTSEMGTGRTGIDVSGPNSPGNVHAELAATNNLFVRAGAALDLNGQGENDLEVFFANNTVVDNANGSILAMSFGESSVQLDLFNNVLVGSDGIGIHAYQGAGSALTLHADHQLLFDNAVDYDGIAPGPNDVHAAPLFVDAMSDRFQLAADSPAIDAGNSAPSGGMLPATDFYGSPRVADGDGDGTAEVDLGAFEVPEPAGAMAALAAIGALVVLQRRPRRR